MAAHPHKALKTPRDWPSLSLCQTDKHSRERGEKTIVKMETERRKEVRHGQRERDKKRERERKCEAES